MFAVGCVDSPHAAHLLNPDTCSRFLSLGGKFKIDQARSPSPGDRARPDGFAAQSHPDAASRTRVRLGHGILSLTDIYTSQIVPKRAGRQIFELRRGGCRDVGFGILMGVARRRGGRDSCRIVGYAGLLAGGQMPEGFSSLLFEE